MIKTLLNINTLSEIEENILSALAYFDLFSYPLNRGEIYLFLPVKCNMDSFNYALNSLVNKQHVYRFGKFYSLRNDHCLIERRNKGNKRAAEMMVTARKICTLLARFPYVRGIGISGSLSKNFADDSADIDLFIITAKNRLWVARTFMHAFKKLTYLFNRQHYFCMNYYIDEQNLEIPEKNTYTATEVLTLIPLQGDAQFVEFFAANAWSRLFLPNNVMRLSSAKPEPKPWIKVCIERMLNNKPGDWLDDHLWQITSTRWDKKTALKKRNVKGQVMAMSTGKHFAKPNPDSFQNQLIEKYSMKTAMVIKKETHNLAISPEINLS